MTCLQLKNKVQLVIGKEVWLAVGEGGQCPAPRALPATLSAARGGAVLPGGGRQAAGSLGRELAGRSGRPTLHLS